MSWEILADSDINAIDKEMRAAWQQADVIPDAFFVHIGDPSRPGTPTAVEAARRGSTPGIKALSTRVRGLVVISQTCDIVAKSMRDAPWVDCAVLVELPELIAADARAGDRPRYAHLPARGDCEFADLDQVVSVEKAALAGMAHDRGVEGAAQQADFGNAVGRKFSRFAFPDDLHETLRDLQDRFKSRHRKDASPEGIALRKVRQIRVEADWEADAVEARLVFILPAGELYRPNGDDEPAPPSADTRDWNQKKHRSAAEVAERLKDAKTPADIAWLWDVLVDAWASLCECAGGIVGVTADVVCADEMKVGEYWNTQRLDLDYLTGSSPED